MQQDAKVAPFTMTRSVAVGQLGKLEVDSLIFVGFLGCGDVKIREDDFQAMSGREVEEIRAHDRIVADSRVYPSLKTRIVAGWTGTSRGDSGALRVTGISAPGRGGQPRPVAWAAPQLFCCNHSECEHRNLEGQTLLVHPDPDQDHLVDRRQPHPELSRHTNPSGHRERSTETGLPHAGDGGASHVGF